MMLKLNIMSQVKSQVQIEEPAISRFLFSDIRMSWLWLLLRLYVGWEWLSAGFEKITSSAWVGSHAGISISGFLHGALVKTAGPHADVSPLYASFINHIAIPNAAIFSYLVAFGEFFVGVALILGLFTGIAAFFGAFMNMNYLFAGTLSVNPVLFIIELFLILAWRTAGYLGLDRFLLPSLGTPWQKGNLFKKKKK